MKFTFAAFFTLIVCQVAAQKVFQFDNSLPASWNEQILSMPFAGGINAAQLQQMDLDGDGQEELVIWDRNSANLLVFVKDGGEYVHQPYLSYQFPEDISGFLILADYDGDGKKDLFTGSPFGIKVYKNNSTNSLPQWEVAQEFLRLDNRSNLQMNSLDVPSIVDIDGDGDLDIVTFNFASGDFLEYYQNTSVERKGVPDVDGFTSALTRWGGFEFCGCDHFSFGQTCAGRPISEAPNPVNLKVEHAGGHSVLLHDFNGDGILDMLMGQDECNKLYYLVNEGSNSNPEFTAYATALPHLGTLPEFPIFHAAYLIDGDLVISTNSSATASQFDADYAQTLYHYPQGKSLATKAFLQEDMIDLGENSRPFFKGSAEAGDLIVTANSLINSGIVGIAYRFTLSADGLHLVDEDYLTLSALGLFDLQYQEFLDADTRRSLFLSGVEIINFTAIRKLYWTAKLEGSGLQELSLPGVQLRGNDHLEFFRHQGENYLLLARQSGELIRYKVEFGEVPKMELLDHDYLGFSDNAANRNLNVHVLEQRGQLDLYTIDQQGMMEYIPDFTNQTGRGAITIQIENGSLLPTRLGRNTWISSIPSGFSGSNDLVLGNTAGGLIYLKDISTGIDPPAQEELQLRIFPNPSTGPVTVLSSSSGSIRLINTLGRSSCKIFPFKKTSAPKSTSAH